MTAQTPQAADWHSDVLMRGSRLNVYNLQVARVWTRRPSSCLSMQLSLMCHYLDRNYSYVHCVSLCKVKAPGPVISLSLCRCCPVLSCVEVCYYSQWWTLTARCINGQCARQLSITDEIGSLGRRSNGKVDTNAGGKKKKKIKTFESFSLPNIRDACAYFTCSRRRAAWRKKCS